ncbi:MAG: HAMP domain-containing protein [Candidatus Omnitrophica bacterium]|nr:HAMP domain-containing protein [Candidatus Omnitrophota bacterium]
MAQKFKRRIYLIKPSFQLRYLGIIFMAVSSVALVCILTTYFSAMSLLGEKLANVYPQGRLMATLKDINMIIIYRLLFVLPIIGFIGIMLSHRIAGPVYRIEKTLEEIGKGNFDIRITLRKHDELKGIANAINDMVAKLKEMMEKKNRLNET